LRHTLQNTGLAGNQFKPQAKQTAILYKRARTLAEVGQSTSVPFIFNVRGPLWCLHLKTIQCRRASSLCTCTAYRTALPGV